MDPKKLSPMQFFDVWSMAIEAVATARARVLPLPVSLACERVSASLAVRHGEDVASEGRAYFYTLLADCQRTSAGEST